MPSVTTPNGPAQLPLQHQIGRRGEASLSQGDLDGLCGLYAAINGLRLLLAPVRQLKRHESKRLFHTGVTLLIEHDLLPSAVVEGFGDKLWRALVQRLVEEASVIADRTIAVHQPLAKLVRPTRSATFAAIEVALAAGQPVLADLSGRHEHFTVISGYSPYSLFLYDSGRLCWLPRASCSIGRARSRRHHINPRSLTILSIQA
ncbi:hypothetical protein [Sphingomonas sp. CROZ-RG-20F-R02-07]|uniref:hypothetical protein n=1 Tax=Sphingomonas sp. CROZ-RG-20F-R02-07 TaxID=2914832 RepID=UPI001F5992E7|nr:hypothetical protein [Sphingomonas sp. CROZ-RG-20F-R02-07]